MNDHIVIGLTAWFLAVYILVKFIRITSMDNNAHWLDIREGFLEDMRRLKNMTKHEIITELTIEYGQKVSLKESITELKIMLVELRERRANWK